MYSKISILIVLVISSFFFSACNDDPTSAGLAVLNKEDLIAVNPDSSFLVSSSSFNSKVDFFASDPILLGSYNGVNSTMLVNFYLSMPDTIKTGILNNTVSVQNAWIDMYPYYTIGSSAASDDFFKVKRINSGWPSTVNFNADSLSKINKDETDLKTGNNFTTSLYSFGVSASNVSAWLKDTSKTTVGLYFEPNAGSQKMVGFHPYYSTDLTYSMRMKVVFVKSGVYSDTVSFYPATDLHLVQGNGIQRPANRICVQGGI
ncbi:MAG: hypothetical protein Q8933_14600, partial [Bacteroidota bacterium]|nr:hypothetical protein [Bacteroidota bacterium]